MNLDLSIHRMAFREAASLGEAQLLVASKRGELQRQLLLEGRAPTRPTVERAVEDLERLSEQTLRATRSHTVDKIA